MAQMTYRDALRQALREEMLATSACFSWAKTSARTAAPTP